MKKEHVDRIIDKETMTLLNDMLVNEKRSDDSASDALAKQKLSDSAADALAKLSCHAKFRDIILDDAAPGLVTMLSEHSSSAAKALEALMRTGLSDAQNVQRLILGYGREISRIDVTPKTETLLLAIGDMLKDRSRSSAAIILTELILEPAAARIIVESDAPKTLLASLKKRNVAHFRAEDYVEYDSLAQCLAAIVKTHRTLRLKAEDANSRPLDLPLLIQEDGAILLFGLMGKNSPNCRNAADAVVALTEHDGKNETILNNVLMGQDVKFLENLGNKLEQINDADNPPANLSALASDVASMIMVLAVLSHANAKRLEVVFRLLHDLWLKAFVARTSSLSNEDVGDKNDYIETEGHADDRKQVVLRGDAFGEEHEEGKKQDVQVPRDDAYGEQADLVADAIAKAIRHSSQTVLRAL
ncbi:hypothetical protein FIBSPDRAFT_194554 [Athelia psychrophila]|uniref:UNC-45/Cro1/She4 central domain-containing protein n=1 Tax=Athelia psychrophila TaxID=1759441 RepID=A0A166SLH4_9AGAM|nr:hypothetical protein FIBSPDRAFT_194554 [Fibularhizoctonia sp. CBS 109695]